MTWKLLTTVLFAVLATMLPPASGVQDDRPEGGRDQRTSSDKSAAERRRARNIETLREMQGGWQLMELRAPELPDAGRQDVGYMIVSSEFASIEVHIAYFDEGEEEVESFIQTGTYRLNFNIYGDLIAKLLIGSMDTGLGFTAPREPGTLSVYEARVVGDVLTLTTESGTRLTFERMAGGDLTLLLFEDTEWLPRAAEAAVTDEEGAEVETPTEEGDH